MMKKQIADLLEIYLISDGISGIKSVQCKRGTPHSGGEKNSILVLLDVMMPDMDGIAMCRRIRETNNIPDHHGKCQNRQDIDKIVGLSTGADELRGKTVQSAGADGACQNPSSAATAN